MHFQYYTLRKETTLGAEALIFYICQLRKDLDEHINIYSGRAIQCKKKDAQTFALDRNGQHAHAFCGINFGPNC